jgi:hypothetical protein
MTTTKTTETGRTLDLTPSFNYSREVEIVKRFIEKVSYAPSLFSDPREIADWLGKVLPQVRKAMGLVMSNDIERQILITKDFPIRFSILDFHEYTPYEASVEVFAGSETIPCSTCDGQADALAHLLA